MSSLYISAASKSSGKTSISIGLCAALRAQGKRIQAYKKGPDYIDPLWLTRASGRNCYNLDFNTMQSDEIFACIAQHSADVDTSIIEGNKGLYDGLDLDGSNSNAAMAALLSTPIVLVIDARGMTRGIAPLILGYQAFDSRIRIAGVILNQLGGSRHEAKLRAVIEHYTDVPVIGALQHDEDLIIDERHLGLIPSNEASLAADKVRRLSDAVTQQVDLDALSAIADEAPVVARSTGSQPLASPSGLRIGLAACEAFGFYYADDLERFRQLGAEIVEIDLQRDRRLPEIDGLFLGGGFPESRLTELEANTEMRDAIRAVIEADLPVYAECGGLMYLSRSISWHGDRHEMVGAIPGDIVMEARPQGRGLVRIEANASHPWGIGTGTVTRAHEFHYSRFDGLDENACFAYKVRRGHCIDGTHDGYTRKRLLACYSHQRDTRDNPWVERFVEYVRQHKN